MVDYKLEIVKAIPVNCIIYAFLLRIISYVMGVTTCQCWHQKSSNFSAWRTEGNQHKILQDCILWTLLYILCYCCCCFYYFVILYNIVLSYVSESHFYPGPEFPFTPDRAWLPRPKSSSPLWTTSDRPITSQTCIGKITITYKVNHVTLNWYRLRY